MKSDSKAIMIETLKKRNQELLILLETLRTLTGKLDLKELLNEIMHQATKLVGADSSSLMLIDEKTKELIFDIAMGSKGDKVKTMRLKMGEGIAGWVAKEGKTLVVQDVSKDKRFDSLVDEATSYKTKSIMCVPLLVKGKPIGVMEAINKKNGEFVKYDLDIFIDFAAQAAVAIENAKLFGSLEQEKGKIEAMFGGMGDGAVFTDENFNILMMNKAAGNLLNLEEDKVVGKNFRDMEEDFDFSGLDKMKEDNTRSMILDLARKKGKKLYISCRITGILNEEGATIGYIMVLRDITIEKTELMMTRDFFSLISHKLKTPLVAITGYTPMLLKEDEFGKLNKFQKSAIKSIDDQGRHLQSLIEKILTFTSIGTDELSLNYTVVGLNDIVDMGMKDIGDIILKKNAKVTRDETLRENPEIRVDSDKIAVVIRSMIENAIKFNDKQEPLINLSAKKTEDGKIEITIQDNGPGIPSEEYENIFRKFYQVEEFFTGQVEGAGLGLAFAKEVVECHKGKIEVTSKIGEGSTFTITLPIE